MRWDSGGRGSAGLPARWQHADRLACGHQHGTRLLGRVPAPCGACDWTCPEPLAAREPVGDDCFNWGCSALWKRNKNLHMGVVGVYSELCDWSLNF
jgi:hypothetical protein